MSNEIRVCGHVLPADGPLPALNRRREALGLQPLWTRPITRAERAVLEPVEPRCRVCRNPEVRHLVNGLLDWRRVPVPVGRWQDPPDRTERHPARPGTAQRGPRPLRPDQLRLLVGPHPQALRHQGSSGLLERPDSRRVRESLPGTPGWLNLWNRYSQDAEVRKLPRSVTSQL